MCLHTKMKTPRIAKRKIYVYKMLLKKGDKYYAPIINVNHSIEYEYRKGVNYPLGEKKFISITTDKKYEAMIEDGWLHGYKTNSKSTVDTLCTNWNWAFFDHTDCNNYFIVVKMYIPKGAEYYVSDDNKQVCSSCLVWED